MSHRLHRCITMLELFAEDVDHHMAVLPIVVTPTQEITIDDIQVGDPGIPITDDRGKLRQMIWRSHHLLIEKGNALVRGAVCDNTWVGPTRLRRGSDL